MAAALSAVAVGHTPAVTGKVGVRLARILAGVQCLFRSMSQSKWATIRLHKAKTDAAKNATYTKLSRAITVAARQGEPDPDANFALRAAVQKARVAGLPNDNIERAIARGSGLLTADDQLEALRYEGYGPGGVAVLMEILTDNRNRTAADVRAAFNKCGGNLGETGCVGWMFQQKGVVRIDGALAEDELFLVVADAGGDDLMVDPLGADAICDPAHLESLSGDLLEAGYAVSSSSLRWLPNTIVTVDEVETARQIVTLVEKLEALDDVQSVFTNFVAADEVLELLAGML